MDRYRFEVTRPYDIGLDVIKLDPATGGDPDPRDPCLSVTMNYLQADKLANNMESPDESHLHLKENAAIYLGACGLKPGQRTIMILQSAQEKLRTTVTDEDLAGVIRGLRRTAESVRENARER